MRNKPLTIRAYWDTRAGHVKQTQGLVLALKELTPIQVTDVFLPEYGLGHSISDGIDFMFSFIRNKKNHPDEKTDLIIGTGTHTHLPMLVHRQQNCGKVVTCMTPGWPLTRFMDLCFIPEHDSPPQKYNIFKTTGPPNTAFNRNIHSPEMGLIAVGGKDPKSHTWHSESILRQIRHILETQTDLFWTVSTSPRTPEKTTAMLAALPDTFPGMTFIPFEKTPRGWIEEQYAKASFTWVTGDSMSMVYEAISAGCHVGVISVDWKNRKNKFARALAHLEKNRKIVSFETFKKTSAWPRNSGLNEAGRCAEEILRRWWPERLQTVRHAGQ